MTLPCRLEWYHFAASTLFLSRDAISGHALHPLRPFSLVVIGARWKPQKGAWKPEKGAWRAGKGFLKVCARDECRFYAGVGMCDIQGANGRLAVSLMSAAG